MLPSHTDSFPSFLLVLPLFYSYDPPRPCICVCGSVSFISDSQEYGWRLVYRSRGTLPVATPLEKNNTVNCVYPQWGWGLRSLHDRVLGSPRLCRSYMSNHSFWSLSILIVIFWIMPLWIAAMAPTIKVKILITLSTDLHAGRSGTPLLHSCLFSHPFCSCQSAATLLSCRSS